MTVYFPPLLDQIHLAVQRSSLRALSGFRLQWPFLLMPDDLHRHIRLRLLALLCVNLFKPHRWDDRCFELGRQGIF
jgi:hypothetical protein